MDPFPLVRRMPWVEARPEDRDLLLTREWIVANGLGGYASGTIGGVCTRRYHGLLVAALPAPLGRILMLSHLAEELQLPDGTTAQLGGEERGGALHLPGAGALTEFHLDAGLPVWRYEVANFVVEKRVFMPHRQNTTHVGYRLVSGPGPLPLVLTPAMNFRHHETAVNKPVGKPYALTAVEGRYEFSAGNEFPPLRVWVHCRTGSFTIDPRIIPYITYRIEESRGYEFRGDLWSPGTFHVELHPDQDATLVLSTEGWETVVALHPKEAAQAECERRRRMLAVAPPVARSGVAAELVLATDQFLIRPAGRVEDAARAHANGEEVRSIIAGYHWFTDWGRDTMISLEGLSLVTGRAHAAGDILRTFAHYIRDGLIPNYFPESGKEGLYHTADATLWFFHALDRYIAASGDEETLAFLVPKLRDVVEHHLRGTRFGIGVDPEDGLLRQGQEGYQLTWMDAKVGDWVVTPRRGKAVEINALWYNALRLLEGWVRRFDSESAAAPLAEHAERARRSFNRRFWYAEGGYLYDIVDGEKGDDPACRPNQIFAISLDHPVLDEARWAPVLDVVRERLLTPVGLRSLAPGHPDYKPKYYGDLRARDAAYHQGTVWAWLAGPFVDAWLKVHPDDRRGARRVLDGFVPHLDEAALGTISEIFDAEAPYTPRGCVAQAWSVAEVLRAWVKTAE